jgi:hypothetical protein
VARRVCAARSSTSFDLRGKADNRSRQAADPAAWRAQRIRRPRPIAPLSGRDQRPICFALDERQRHRDAVALEVDQLRRRRVQLLETQLAEGTGRRLRICRPDHNVDVAVLPGNTTDQEVDGPPASEPTLKLPLFQTGHSFGDHTHLQISRGGHTPTLVPNRATNRHSLGRASSRLIADNAVPVQCV